MDDFIKQSLLFDFYGDLLTDHQKEVYGAYIQENLSFSEIAQDFGISRQGVYDLIKRCTGILEGYEERLQLIKRFMDIKEKIKQISDADSLEQAKSISNDIMELL